MSISKKMLNTRCLISCCNIGIKGVTLIELIAVMAIISILAAGIMPLSKMAYKRSREIELRQALRTIRTAIDKYKSDADEKKIVVPFNSTGYPKTLEELVEGVPSLAESGKKRKYLRRVPRDPMTEDGTWNMRSYADEPDSTIWSGEDVYDVYSKSDKTAIDGTFYKDW